MISYKTKESVKPVEKIMRFIAYLEYLEDTKGGSRLKVGSHGGDGEGGHFKDKPDPNRKHQPQHYYDKVTKSLPYILRTQANQLYNNLDHNKNIQNNLYYTNHNAIVYNDQYNIASESTNKNSQANYNLATIDSQNNIIDEKIEQYLNEKYQIENMNLNNKENIYYALNLDPAEFQETNVQDLQTFQEFNDDIDAEITINETIENQSFEDINPMNEAIYLDNFNQIIDNTIKAIEIGNKLTEIDLSGITNGEASNPKQEYRGSNFVDRIREGQNNEISL